MRGPIVTRSELAAPPEEVWAHATSFEGVNAEFGGLLRMTAPRDVRERGLAGVTVGERVCRSWILLFGLIPFDYDDITLIELDPPRGFHERSSMLSNRVWEHRRTIEPATGGCVVTDTIRYEPRLPVPHAILRRVYGLVFAWRHRNLRRRFAVTPEGPQDDHTAFREAVAASKLQDWRPTFENLSAEVGVPVDDLVHHALVRWVSAGSEALLSIEPQALRDLQAAREREDWDAVAGIIDWLGAGT